MGQMIVRAVPVAEIMPNPEQPRKQFDREALKELAASIQQNGLRQPIIVTPIPKRIQAPDRKKYLIVAGERRWRAHQIADIKTVRALIQNRISCQGVDEVALLENINRRDLQPLEEANAYQRMMDVHGHTEETLATLLGFGETKRIKDRVALLRLAPELQEGLRTGAIALSQAQEMTRLTIEGQFRLWQLICDGKCSTADTCRRMALAIHRAENQVELFKDESKLTESELASLSRVDLFLHRADALLGLITEADMAVVRHIPKADAPACIAKLDQLMSVMTYLRGTLSTSVAKQHAIQVQ